MKNSAAVISVSWGNDVDVSIKLTPRNWKRVQSGKPLHLRGKGYYYDGNSSETIGALEAASTVPYACVMARTPS